MGQGKFDTFNSLGSAQFKTIDYITNERNIFNGECILIQYFEYFTHDLSLFPRGNNGHAIFLVFDYIANDRGR